MKIYDITQEIFNCRVYPGDPSPKKEVLSSIESGDICNLSAFSMCSHNGTHIDSPYHFINKGKTIDKIPLDKLIGVCCVVEFSGVLGAEDARYILAKAGNNASKRILLKGNAVVSIEAAKVFAEAGIFLIGNESQTVGPEEAPLSVHLELLSAEVVLLEGIRLEKVPQGEYFLFAAPILLGGGDGAPVRAVLIET